MSSENKFAIAQSPDGPPPANAPRINVDVTPKAPPSKSESASASSSPILVRAEITADWNEDSVFEAYMKKAAAEKKLQDEKEERDLAELQKRMNEMRERVKNQPKLTPTKSQEKFNEIVKKYYDAAPHIKHQFEYPELEVKFGTRGIKRINKIDYDNVICKLKSLGFILNQPKGEYFLRMENQYLDPASGRFKMSNVRMEVNGMYSIKKYCELNAINHEGIMKNANVKEFVDSVDFDDFNFRMTYNIEKTISPRGKMGQDILNKWDNSKKRFRYINRVVLKRKDLPLKIELSIVKSSGRTDKGAPILSDNFGASGVMNNPESYEIEIEVDNSQLGYPEFLANGSAKSLQESIRKAIKYVLSGLQGTNYPISYVEQSDTLGNYMRLLHKESVVDRKITSRDFIGPQPFTLQMKNIVPVNKNATDFNIRTGYVVTEKADGERNLLYINPLGKLYLINSSMKVAFTGTIINDKTLYSTLLDGELILHDKNGNFINLYAAFDIYYINGEDIRDHYFMPENEKDDVLKSRYYIMTDTITSLNPVPIVAGELIAPLKISYKSFYPQKSTDTIFDACNTVLTNINEGLFLYNTDGLIFTPISYGVGSYEKGKAGKLEKVPWECAFKWKPPKFNTIDFLVTTKKTPAGQDEITTIYESGVSVNQAIEPNEYKTLILECGINEKNDIYLNPCQNVIDDVLPEFISDTRNAYKHVQFYPTSPYDAEAGVCNILLKTDNYGEKQMYTEEGEVFENNTIVEFSYDLNDPNKGNTWRWTPLRVRYDKTSELRNGLKNYGNDYRVANSNWTSIHNPITEAMLMYGDDIPEVIFDDDVYYNESSNKHTTTRGLRDFHNLFVKKLLITSVSKSGDTLIDVACGKGGDFPKWIASNLSFVFGIDVFKDNLENRLNGACARYLNLRKQFKQMPHALFVHGNSSENIRSGQAMFNEKGTEITKAIFGQGARDSQKLGKGVLRQFARAADGFNVTSCQFAIHYFWENKHTFYNFIRNVAECTRLGGYFIGTCYDGNVLFNRLKSSNPGEGLVINSPDGSKMWEVVKEYTSDTFEDDDSCLGYKISVFQESINKLIPEFLVNHTFLNRIMQDYGFKLIGKSEAKSIGLPDGSAMFSNLFGVMQQEINNNPEKVIEYKESENMTANEKTISFLNRYFVYKKIAAIDAEKLTTILLHKDAEEYVNEQLETSELANDIEKIEKEESKQQTQVKAKTRAKKINAKLLLVPATEAVTEEPSSSNVAAVINLDDHNVPTIVAQPLTIKIDEVADIDDTDIKNAPKTPSSPATPSPPKEEKEKEKEKDAKTLKAEAKLLKAQAMAAKAQVKLQKEMDKAAKAKAKEEKAAKKMAKLAEKEAK